MIRLLCLAIGYVFGLIQTAYIIGKTRNIDIRDSGSGNSGTTNAMRVLGKKAGIITFIVDVLKAIAAICIVRYFIARPFYPDIEFTLVLYAGLGVILGHNFPFYMNFKGGKGIAATAGMIIGLWNPWLIILGLAAFGLAVGITRYVSLGSLCVVTGFLIEVIILGQAGSLTGFGPACVPEAYIIAFLITALAFIRHKDNIKRLANHTERKIGEKKEEN